MSSEPLQEAYRLIREGRQQEAVQVLLPFVRADPLNADAWWLLANAVENNDQKRSALERVLKLRPNDQRAQRMIATLPSAESAAPEAQDSSDEPFADLGDTSSSSDGELPYDNFPVQQPVRVKVKKSSGRSPLTIILAIIGLIAVLSCGVCAVAVVAGGTIFGRVVQEVILTVTYVPDFGTLMSLGTPNAPSTLPSDLTDRGSIEAGQTVRASVDTFTDDSWTFNADAGTHVIIELNATDKTLDPQLYLYDTDRVLLAENDDISMGTNNNSRIEMTLPNSGTYTIVVSAFGTGGPYELTLRR